MHAAIHPAIQGVQIAVQAATTAGMATPAVVGTENKHLLECQFTNVSFAYLLRRFPLQHIQYRQQYKQPNRHLRPEEHRKAHHDRQRKGY